MPKSLVSELLRIVNMLRGTKHCLSLHGSIFVKFLYHSQKKRLEKLCFSSILNLGTVCLHIDTRWQAFSLSKSECLTKRIQMLLSQNQKIFSEFFAAFPKSTKNLEYFE